MEYFFMIICFLVFLLVDYFTIPYYIKRNKDLFWSLYHDMIINELSKNYERFDEHE